MDKKDRKAVLEAYKTRRAAGGVFAINNAANGKSLMMHTTDLNGSRNRIEFSKTTGSCAYKQLQDDYNKYGAEAFTFVVLEELIQKEGQTEDEFKLEIEALYGILLQDIEPAKLY